MQQKKNILAQNIIQCAAFNKAVFTDTLYIEKIYSTISFSSCLWYTFLKCKKQKQTLLYFSAQAK